MSVWGRVFRRSAAADGDGATRRVWVPSWRIMFQKTKGSLLNATLAGAVFGLALALMKSRNANLANMENEQRKREELTQAFEQRRTGFEAAVNEVATKYRLPAAAVEELRRPLTAELTPPAVNTPSHLAPPSAALPSTTPSAPAATPAKKTIW